MRRHTWRGASIPALRRSDLQSASCGGRNPQSAHRLYSVWLRSSLGAAHRSHDPIRLGRLTINTASALELCMTGCGSRLTIARSPSGWPGTARICGIRGATDGKLAIAPVCAGGPGEFRRMRLKGRVIPWKALYDNNLRQLSRKTVTTPCFGLSLSPRTPRLFLTRYNIP